MRRFFFTSLNVLLSIQFLVPCSTVYAAASPQVADFLCEKGISYYQNEQYPLALTEFKKALLANPESVVAKEYIQEIEGENLPREDKNAVIASSLENTERAVPSQKALSISKESEKTGTGGVSLVLSDFEQEIISKKKEKKALVSSIAKSESPKPPPEEIVVDVSAKAKEGIDVIEIETNVGDRLVLKGKNVSRFVVVDPVLLKVSRMDVNNLLIEPQQIGATYLHWWDEENRKTFKIKIGPRRIDEEALEVFQERARESNLPETFKVSYSIEGDSFNSGRGVGDLKRQSQSISYSSSLIGETPYGNFDSAVAGDRTETGAYRVSNIRMGLTDGHYDELKNITIRGFDFTPYFPAFGFPVSDLRGIMVDAPMFSNRLHQTSFWGAIPLGGFTGLSATSGLSQTKNAWLEGTGLDYRPFSNMNLKGYWVHSYGPDLSQPVLTHDAQGLGLEYYKGPFNFDSEMSTDTRNISYTASGTWTFPRFRIGLSMTDNNKDYASLLGGNPGSGSVSEALNLAFRPTDDLTITNSFSANRDKVFGNPDRPGRPNYSSATRLNWVLDSMTEMELGYALDDEIGSNTPSVTETKEVIFRKKLFFIRRLSTFISYQNQKSKNFTSPAQNFNNNRILMGVNFRLISELYAYYNREFNYLRNTFTNETAIPMAQEIGLNYYHQVFHSPFYTNLRLSYRDEEHTESVLSTLSGEDRLEGEGELSFRPNSNTETFIRARIANVWAEREGVAKHLDFDISWGLRFLWDTGLRWFTVGSFTGYVFYDINGDGVKQPDEKGVGGVKIKAPDGKTVVTDARGFYKISGIKGRSAVLELDLKTLPKGYSPTTSPQWETDIVHGKTKRIDFGITARCEISGLVFYDKNNNGAYDTGEQPQKGVVIILDDKQKAATTSLGEYMFRKLSPGEHTLKLDLKTLPVKFIPKVPVIKTIKVVEGTGFVYNIPLQLQEKNPTK